MNQLLASEVRKAMQDDRILTIAAETALSLGEKNLNDAEVIAVTESINNFVYKLLKENGVELVNDWE